MRRRLTAALMTLALLFLTSCGRSAAQDALDNAREKLAASEAVVLTAELDADSRYTLRVTWTKGESTVEVLEPESIAGVKAHIGSDGAGIEYDGFILNLGELTRWGLSPASAVPLMLSAVLDAHAETLWSREDGYYAKLIPFDEYSVTVRLDSDGTLRGAEITDAATGETTAEAEITEINYN